MSIIPIISYYLLIDNIASSCFNFKICLTFEQQDRIFISSVNSVTLGAHYTMEYYSATKRNKPLTIFIHDIPG